MGKFFQSKIVLGLIAVVVVAAGIFAAVKHQADKKIVVSITTPQPTPPSAPPVTTPTPPPVPISPAKPIAPKPPVVTPNPSPSIKITAPADGAQLTSGTTETITWNSTSVKTINIFFSGSPICNPNEACPDFILGKTPIASEIPNTGSYKWHVGFGGLNITLTVQDDISGVSDSVSAQIIEP